MTKRFDDLFEEDRRLSTMGDDPDPPKEGVDSDEGDLIEEDDEDNEDDDDEDSDEDSGEESDDE
jgi:hypothetical protein